MRNSKMDWFLRTDIQWVNREAYLTNYIGKTYQAHFLFLELNFISSKNVTF